MSFPTRFSYRLAAIDIDETLVGADKAIDPANRRAVARLQAAGCRIILASGRRHANMHTYYRELGLQDFAVSCQGARIEHSASGAVLHRAVTSAGRTTQLVEAGASQGFAVFVWSHEGIYATGAPGWTTRYVPHTGNDTIDEVPLSFFAGRGAEKIVWAGDPAAVAAAAESWKAKSPADLMVFAPTPWCLEFSDPQATKGTAVAAIAHAAAIPRQAVLAFGDGTNDVSLLAWAGHGVAMPHGHPAAIASAAGVAPAGPPETALARAVDLLFGSRG